VEWLNNPRTRLYCISVFVLLAGLTSAFIIYRHAISAQGEVLGYEIGNDGKVYPIMPGDSKAYQRSLEVYGGKANVMTDKFRRWFVGLWLGRSLASTVSIMSILASTILFFIARRLPVS
jgi:hypothetical protein